MYKLYFWLTAGTTIIIDAMALVLWVVVFLYAQSLNTGSANLYEYNATWDFALFFTASALLLTPGLFMMKHGWKLAGALVALAGHVFVIQGIIYWANNAA